MITGLRKEVLEFAFDMEDKLKQNDYKSHWQDETPSYLLNRMQEELNELRHSYMNGKIGKAIIQEAADIANFAMMMADIYREDV